MTAQVAVSKKDIKKIGVLGSSDFAVISVRLESELRCKTTETFKVKTTDLELPGIKNAHESFTSENRVFRKGDSKYAIQRGVKLWGRSCVTMSDKNKCKLFGVASYTGWKGGFIYAALGLQ